MSPDQYIVAEQKHEQERVIAKKEKQTAPAKNTEALRVSIDQLREVWVVQINVFENTSFKAVKIQPIPCRYRSCNISRRFFSQAETLRAWLPERCVFPAI